MNTLTLFTFFALITGSLSFFPGDVYVTNGMGERIRMKDLNVGDKILGYDHGKGVVETEVTAWVHRVPDMGTNFYKLVTRRGTLCVSGSHNVASVHTSVKNPWDGVEECGMCNCSTTNSNLDNTETNTLEFIEYKHADKFQINDTLVSPYMTPEKVYNIKEVMRYGVYSPYTTTGNLFVGDGDVYFLTHTLSNVDNPHGWKHNVFSAAMWLTKKLPWVHKITSDYLHPVVHCTSKLMGRPVFYDKPVSYDDDEFCSHSWEWLE